MQRTKLLAEGMGFPAQEILFLQLATEEACTNALDHCVLLGYGCCEIHWYGSDTTIQIMVCQEGRAFDFDKSACTEMEEYNDGLRGRGLVLITGLMDETEILHDEDHVMFIMRKTKKSEA
jgi:serine/threonine-protein kinase RsbW